MEGSSLSAVGIHQRVPATVDQVPRVRHDVLAFIDAHYPAAARDRQDIALALTEACANVVLHAYPDDGAGLLTITATVDGQRLTIQIGEQGTGNGAAADSTGLRLGVPLMQALADTAIRSDEHGTTVQLGFPRTA
jgi:serine/threonine-protein kinase RsbW